MNDQISRSDRKSRWVSGLQLVRNRFPRPANAALAAISGCLLVLSFPDANLWWLAWIALIPVLVAASREQRIVAAFALGWICGTIFFYGSCYWLTYSMIRYGGIPPLMAYLLLFPVTAVVGIFPGFAIMLASRAFARWGGAGLALVAFFWPAMEWARLGLTGQLWNAIGYSQAYTAPFGNVPALIQCARWGGVYLVGFAVVAVNSALAILLIDRSRRSILVASSLFALAVLVVSGANLDIRPAEVTRPIANVVAIQPNVPMTPVTSLTESAALVQRHLVLTKSGLDSVASNPELPRVVIWPESPMSFIYTEDLEFQEFIRDTARSFHASILFNALEPAPAGGAYNSAVMVDATGRLAGRYDKIRLLPFGEYVPVPGWIPGAGLIPTMVGDFTPGTNYPLMPFGTGRSGVFICFESAFPSVAREFAREGADVLVNISNDGYLGPTPVQKQHLANAVFRAVENRRDVVRVTNTGISALITRSGVVMDATSGFVEATRTWTVSSADSDKTPYTRYGDIFALLCAIVTGVSIAFLIRFNRPAGRVGE